MGTKIAHFYEFSIFFSFTKKKKSEFQASICYVVTPNTGTFPLVGLEEMLPASPTTFRYELKYLFHYKIKIENFASTQI
jgi:hypothetical protein